MKPRRRWYRLTPDQLLLALLAAVLLLLLADRFELFGLERGSGFNVLRAVGLVIGAGVVALLWLGISLILRRRFQFGVRSLLLFVVVCAIVCSWFAVKMNRVKRQREVVEAIVKAGGGVTYDYQYSHPIGSPKTATPPAPAWLRNLLGDDLFRDVVSVNLRTDCGDAELEHAKGLARLKFLTLFDAKITDAGLVHLRGLPNLKLLMIESSGFTDAGMEHLKGLTNLKGMWVDSPRVTDAGLEYLEGLTGLRELYLINTPVTPEAVEELQKALPNCEILR